MKLRTVISAVLPICLAESVGVRAVSASDLLAYGEHLAQECVTCHRRDGAGRNSGIPPIAGLGQDDFIEAMKLYKSGVRPNQVMVSVARSLDETQIKALAAYFAQQGPVKK
ncbi:MAG: cytochrome c [Hyphomicrobiaceae bacterium]